jgi:hypothetical protein
MTEVLSGTSNGTLTAAPLVEIMASNAYYDEEIVGETSASHDILKNDPTGELRKV